MGQQVWLRISLVFGALLLVFAGLGLLSITDVGSPLATSFQWASVLVSASSSAIENCDESEASPYSPFSIRVRRDSNSAPDQRGSSSGSQSSQPPPGSSTDIPTFYDSGSSDELLSWIALLIAAVVVIVLLYHLFKNLLGRPIYREAAAAGLPGSAAGLGVIAPQDAFSQAEALAAKGQYRDALRLLYQGVLSRIAQLGLIDLEKRRTNWEVLRLLQHRGQLAVHQNMIPLTQLFDKSWYGIAPITESEYQTARQASRGILEGVKPA